MNFIGSNVNQGCGCNNGCPTVMPTYQQCNQVVQTCNVEEVPHYINYHTHVVNNCIKRHVNVPTYSTSGENVMINEYVQGVPMPYMYQQPYMYNQNPYMQEPNMQQPTFDTNVGNGNYQGNVNPNTYNPYRF